MKQKMVANHGTRRSARFTTFVRAGTCYANIGDEAEMGSYAPTKVRRTRVVLLA